MAAENAPNNDTYDLLVLVDATYSMFDYLDSLKSSLPKIIAISNLTDAFARIGVLAYRDYTEVDREKDGMLEWSGWYDHNSTDNDDAQTNENGNLSSTISEERLMQMASTLEPIGGGDYPEATKTALAKAYQLMRGDATTIVLLYTDAPPHCWMVADKDAGGNFEKERMALQNPQSFGGYGPVFADWVSAAKQLHQGQRKAHVFSFLDHSLQGNPMNSGFYTYLSTLTRGACMFLTDTNPHSIAQVTVDVLLAWMGVEKVGVENSVIPATMVRYKNGKTINRIHDERDEFANLYFWAREQTSAKPNLQLPTSVAKAQDQAKLKEAMGANIAEASVDAQVLKRYLPKRKTLVGDFAQRYTKDGQYRKLVTEQLRRIIEREVTSMSLNPVFGTLWRAVCNDRDNLARDDLVKLFSLHVDRIKDAEARTRMKNWLEESYDYAAEVLEDLSRVPESERFPCVFLDPTVDFQQVTHSCIAEHEEGGDDDDRPVTSFRRDELLEIGRSCDGRVLSRLGKILTRLTYVKSAEDLPAHIAATSDAEVSKIPLYLASDEGERKFWKILLHVVLPGTKLSARPAVVLAALAIRIGLKPLFEPACAAMRFWRDKWNNVEVPENWSPGCLGLLLDADKEYRNQLNVEDKETSESLLLQDDRELFTKLLAYHYAGQNLLTTLMASTVWTPSKAQAPIGHLVECRSCKFPRSVTIMTNNGRCGLCEASDWTDAGHKARAVVANVTHEDTSASTACWVECSVRTCHAQYVCYNPSDLSCRAKCHYCRAQGKLPLEQKSANPAPTIECAQCLSKIIWPSSYRSAAPSPFICPACTNGHETISQIPTTAKQLCAENGTAWLMKDPSHLIPQPFARSIYHTISTPNLPPASFLQNIQILPPSSRNITLTLQGKLIQNTDTILTTLSSWIHNRTAQRTPCSLCFTSTPNSSLLPACRRKACSQRICTTCLHAWYGLNAPGTLLNISALSCPFCRRSPAPRTLAAYGNGVYAVAGLADAVKDSGEWIHAWCRECGTAARYMARECSRGAPPPVTDFECAACARILLERERIATEQALAELKLARDTERADQQLAEDIELAEQMVKVRANAARARVRAGTSSDEYEEVLQRHLRELQPFKRCPACKVRTAKDEGCDHMTCLCGAHWCWRCGEEGGTFDLRRIYEHLGTAHRAWWNEHEWVENPDYEWEDCDGLIVDGERTHRGGALRRRCACGYEP